MRPSCPGDGNPSADCRNVIRATVVAALLLGLAAGASGLAAQGLPVIPGAQGFGINTPAGRGGTVYRVTNLNDSGTGSLRACAQASGPRVCVFETSGTINLGSELSITNPFVTVAGQTAPSPGIMLTGNGLRIRTHDILLQHLRIRTGDINGGQPDCIKLEDSNSSSAREIYNVVVDHMSCAWAIDENTSTWTWTNPIGHRVRDVTFRYNIIAEGLDASTHANGPHSKGMLIGDGHRNIAILDNVFAHNADRNPEIKGGSRAVVANNIIYNWDPSQDATQIGNGANLPGEPTYLSVVGNLYKRGPDMPLSRSAYAVEVYSGSDPGSLLYMSDNVHPNITLFKNDASYDPRVSSPPIWIDGYSARPGSHVETWLLDRAGARPADRDAVDRRVIDSVRNGTGKIIDSQTEVGSYPTVAVNARPLTLPADPNGDADGDGYTNLEEWLHGYSAEVEGSVPNAPPDDVTGLHRTDSK